MNFPKIQQLFKLLVASGLGGLNLVFLLWVIAKTQSAIFCSSLVGAIPDSLVHPLKVNLSGFLELPINLVLKSLEAVLNFFVWLVYGFGQNSIQIPLLHLKEFNANTSLRPLDLIPYLREPQHILSLCNYSNSAAGIILAVLVTTLLSTLTVAIVTSNLPQRWGSFWNRHAAMQASNDIKNLRKNLQNIELADLDYSLQRQLQPIKDLLKNDEYFY